MEYIILCLNVFQGSIGADPGAPAESSDRLRPDRGRNEADVPAAGAQAIPAAAVPAVVRRLVLPSDSGAEGDGRQTHKGRRAARGHVRHRRRRQRRRMFYSYTSLSTTNSHFSIFLIFLRLKQLFYFSKLGTNFAYSQVSNLSQLQLGKSPENSKDTILLMQRFLAKRQFPIEKYSTYRFLRW